MFTERERGVTSQEITFQSGIFLLAGPALASERERDRERVREGGREL